MNNKLNKHCLGTRKKGIKEMTLTRFYDFFQDAKRFIIFEVRNINMSLYNTSFTKTKTMITKVIL